MREEKGKGRGKSGASGLIGTVDHIILIFACALLYDRPFRARSLLPSEPWLKLDVWLVGWAEVMTWDIGLDTGTCPK